MFNHTQKTMSIFGIRFQPSLSTLGFVLLRPLAPLLPTQLRGDWLPSLKRARADLTRHMGAWQEYVYVDVSRKCEQVNRKRCPECLALCTATPDCQQGIRHYLTL